MQDINRYNEKTASIERIEFTILGNKEIKNLSVLDKDSAGLLSSDLYENGEPKKGVQLIHDLVLQIIIYHAVHVD